MSEGEGGRNVRLRMVCRKKQWSAMALGLVSGLAFFGLSNTGGVAAKGDPKRPATEPAQVKIDLDRAVAVKLPEVAGLKAAGFHTSDGKEGWVVRIPGNRPIATPAYADGGHCRDLGSRHVRAARGETRWRPHGAAARRAARRHVGARAGAPLRRREELAHPPQARGGGGAVRPPRLPADARDPDEGTAAR